MVRAVSKSASARGMPHVTVLLASAVVHRDIWVVTVELPVALVVGVRIAVDYVVVSTGPLATISPAGVNVKLDSPENIVVSSVPQGDMVMTAFTCVSAQVGVTATGSLGNVSVDLDGGDRTVTNHVRWEAMEPVVS